MIWLSTSVGEGGMQFILGFRFEPFSFERTLQQQNNKQSRLRQRARLEISFAKEKSRLKALLD